LPLIDNTWREVLFPGLLPILLTLSVAVLATLRRSALVVSQQSQQGRGAVLGFYGALALMGFWISLGPAGGLYALLYHTLPVFSLLRAPARFGLIVTLAMAVLGGIGFASLIRLVPGRGRPVVAMAALMLITMRSTVWGLVLHDAKPLPLAHARLKVMPRAPVVSFPYWVGAADRHRHTEYMLLSTAHWQPLVNGYSDHIPRALQEDKPNLATFPNSEAWSALRERNVRYVLMHWNLFPPEERQGAINKIRELVNYLRVVVHQPDVSLYEIIAWPGD
jgi:hypothetical protein